MVIHICTNCNYRFDAENAIECPYCGQEGLEKEKSAGELLEEVDRLLKE